MPSETVRQWLTSAWSGCLLVHGNCDAFIAESSLSLLCAKAVGIFSAKPKIFVLGYFCGPHTQTNHPRDNAIGTVSILLGQLILQSEQPNLDLGLAVFDPKKLRGSKEDALPDLLWMFRKCILRLPHAYTIYCIIDGISFCETSQRRDITLIVLHNLCQIVTKARDIVFKFLVTAPGRSQSIYRLFDHDELLDVPWYIQNDAPDILDYTLNDLAEMSARRPNLTRGSSGSEELQELHDWWDRNDSRESLVFVEVKHNRTMPVLAVVSSVLSRPGC